MAGMAPDARQSHKVVTVLAVTPSEADRVSLRNLFSHTNWVLLEAGNCAECLEFLSREPVPVLLCEAHLPDGGWKLLLGELRERRHPPAFIVVSPHADERLWSEVLNSGAYDLLVKPFERTELVRVVSLAWRQWKADWEGCSHAGHTIPG